MSLYSDLIKLIRDIETWTARPTKNGAKNLRNAADEIRLKNHREHLVAVFYDRKNSREVRSSELMKINVSNYYAGLNNEGERAGTPLSKCMDKELYVAVENMADFGYKSEKCPSYCNWDNYCQIHDLVFLRFE